MNETPENEDFLSRESMERMVGHPVSDEQWYTLKDWWVNREEIWQESEAILKGLCLARENQFGVRYDRWISYMTVESVTGRRFIPFEDWQDEGPQGEIRV